MKRSPARAPEATEFSRDQRAAVNALAQAVRHWVRHQGTMVWPITAPRLMRKRNVDAFGFTVNLEVRCSSNVSHRIATRNDTALQFCIAVVARRLHIA